MTTQERIDYASRTLQAIATEQAAADASLARVRTLQASLFKAFEVAPVTDAPAD